MSEQIITAVPRLHRGWLAAWVIVAIFGTAWTALSRPDSVQSGPARSAALPGYLAPDFTLPALDGAPLTLSDFRGQPVVLNFWASWCGPCRIETPHFQALHAEYGDALVVLGVNQGESAETISRFGSEFSLTYPLLLDAGSVVNRTYGVVGLPTTLFINADGTIDSVIPGAVNQAVLQSRAAALIAAQ
jgi:thiol-disulfide isomerase/thioredoxin